MKRLLPEKRKIILMGQAPGPKDDDDALGGGIGDRLAELCGLSGIRELDQKFKRMNLLTRFPGKAGKGDKFPRAEAKARALQLTPGLRNRDVIFLGRNVAYAFGLLKVDWFEMIHHRPGSFVCCVAPHPSGVNLWWNDLSNRLYAKKFFEGIANGRFQWMRAIALRMAMQAFEEVVKMKAQEAMEKMERGEL